MSLEKIRGVRGEREEGYSVRGGSRGVRVCEIESGKTLVRGRER